MGEWYIYGVNGSVKATVKKLEYSGEFMGETSVTCDVYSPSPISFSTGDYLVYRGEMFTIDYDATRLKQARNNTYGKGYTYENMRFLSYVGELKKCDFLDFVLNDNLQHYSQLPVFDFYAETVQDLADRLQANLNRIYTGAKAWTVSVASGFEGKENINVQISKIKCLDALRIAYDQFDAQFVIRGRHIYIGTAGSSIATNFKYGKGNGLKSIERSVDESDGLVTRLRAYGNTTNLPANYYANKGRGCYAPIDEVYGIYTKGADIHFKPKFANNWFTEKSGSIAVHYWVSVSLDKILWMDALVSTNVSNTPDFSVVSVADAYGNNTPEMWAAFKTQLQSATQNTRLYFSKGVNYSNWKSEWKETDAYMPDMMSIDRLMLPGFPDEYTDPYLDSDNISTLGVREKSVYFDGSDDELPDIHPSMEGMTAQQLIDAGYTIDLDSGDNGNLDEIAADATENDGSAITTDGAFVEVNEVPGFKVTLKDIGFDINSYLSGETATLSMKTGMCGGRDFNITKVTKVGNKYVLECQRVEDVNRFFPYNPYTIKAGDKFVLTGIEMPDAYIDAASQRLLTAAQEYLAKHSVPEWVYAIKMDDIWLQRQRDNSVSESASYYWNIKEGDIMTIQDTDLGIDVSEVIDRLSIREGYDPLPTFEVVLRKEKPQGTIGKLQNRIKSLERQNQEQAKTIIRQQDYISLVLGDKIIDIQEQVDNAQVTYFYEGVPTLSNYPASEWDVASYPDHVHDMYYDKTTGKAYEFDISGSTYAWSLIQDEDIVRALADASTAQDTADGKRRVFVTAAGTLPTPPYDAGDLWVNATYPSNSTATNTSGNNPLNYTYYNDILKCVTPREEGDATANIGDWRLASKYTDDTLAEEALYKAENVKTLDGNLLLNSGFTGEYESETPTALGEVNDNTPMFSDPLRFWDNSNVEVGDNSSMVTRKAATITSGYLKQSVGFLQHGTYMLSFKASVTSLQVSFAGMSIQAEAHGNVRRYDFSFNVNEDGLYGVVEFIGSATIGEIMLTFGTIPREWQPSQQDNDRSLSEVQQLEYLQKAIAQASTKILGGLVLTQMIKVGNYRLNDQTGDFEMSEETGGLSGYVNDVNSPFTWGGGTLSQAIYTIAKYTNNPAYEATPNEVQQMAQYVVTHGGRAILNDVILRGYIYALGGKFRGSIEAEAGYFKGELRGASGTFKQEISSNDGKVWLTTENSHYGYKWLGLTIGNDDDMSGDLATIGARIDHNGYDYGRIALVKRPTGQQGTDISDCRIYLDASDGSILCKSVNASKETANDVTANTRLLLNSAAVGHILNEFTPSQDLNSIQISQGNKVLVSTDSYNIAYLPTLTNCRAAIGVADTAHFAIDLIVMAASGASFTLYGYRDGSYSDSDCPHIRNYDNYQDMTSGIAMAQGDTLKLELVYNGTFNAFIISQKG